jgi:hypothetical protein
MQKSPVELIQQSSRARTERRRTRSMPRLPTEEQGELAGSCGREKFDRRRRRGAASPCTSLSSPLLPLELSATRGEPRSNVPPRRHVEGGGAVGSSDLGAPSSTMEEASLAPSLPGPPLSPSASSTPLRACSPPRRHWPWAKAE